MVDKKLVELFALAVIAAFPVSGFFGIERRLGALVRRAFSRGPAPDAARLPVGVPALARREVVRSAAAIPALGCFGFALEKQHHISLEERELASLTGGKLDAVTSATVKTFQYASLKDLKGQVPRARICNLEVSRVIMGGIGGWAHARDLLYVSQLVKTYHSDRKVFETLRLGERCGIRSSRTRT